MRSSPDTKQSAAIIVAGLLGGVACFLGLSLSADSQDASSQERDAAAQQRADVNVRRYVEGRITNWWDYLPDSVRKSSRVSGNFSNIHPQDYTGPESCKECHPKNYESWYQHPHRSMNALANDVTVKGDFSSNAQISYLGGTGRFYREGKAYRMELVRGDIRRVYDITQTIGSRFYQYYVGRQLEGPEPFAHKFYVEDYVLPFGYSLVEKDWGPVVHLTTNDPWDGQDENPYDHGAGDHQYSTSCNYCHVTFPLGDQLVRNPFLMGRHAPSRLHWLMSSYLKEARPDLWEVDRGATALSSDEVNEVRLKMVRLDGPKDSVTLGISCEACHLGTKEHAQEKRDRPEFFPTSPHLLLDTNDGQHRKPTRQETIKWTCGRCHSGPRLRYAAGMSTWNSVESDDSGFGACKSQLTCIHCHNPHEAIGPAWSNTADQDDALCLKCHEEYSPASARAAHTHHRLGSEGSRCMNCHMPRLNEGIQYMVRTHMIYSPTRPDMIESNQPNACNLCHARESIDWTLSHLRAWYGAEYSKQNIAKHYPNRTHPATLGWLQRHQAVRMVSADALFRTQSKWALPVLLQCLDDPHLGNRLYAKRGIEEMMGVKLIEFGYRHYMSPDERRGPLKRIRLRLLNRRD